MDQVQMLETILNRGAAGFSLQEMLHSPVNAPEYSEALTEEERLKTFMEILESEEKSEKWASGITTYQIGKIKQYPAQENFTILQASCSQVILKRSIFVCIICLKEVDKLEIVRELPCGHKFHKSCIDPWLKIRAICPVDRKNMLEIV